MRYIFYFIFDKFLYMFGIFDVVCTVYNPIICI